MKLFLQKNAKFRSAGGSAPRLPCLRRLGALPPNPSLRPVGAPPPDPQTAPPHCEFLATRLHLGKEDLNKLRYILAALCDPSLGLVCYLLVGLTSVIV